VLELTVPEAAMVLPSGKQIATIHVDANVTNAAFGGPDGKTLFITGAGAVWQVRLGINGAPY